MKNIGFIGLGIMGGPMAGHILEGGYPVTVYNRTAAKAESLVAKGAKLVSSPKEVALASDIVFIMVKADAEVKDILTGKEGIFASGKKGLIIANSSTVLPATSIKLAKLAAEQGMKMVDLPVTGSGVQAKEGKLTFMCGGDEEVFVTCKPVLLLMGKNAYYMGKSGAGSYTKLASNTMLAVNLLAATEALVLANKAGVDPELFLQVANGGGSRSGMAETKIPKIIARDFKPAFGASMLLKDLGLIGELSKQLEVPMPVTGVVREMMRMAVAEGFGNEDVCSVVKCYEQWAKTTVKK